MVDLRDVPEERLEGNCLVSRLPPTVRHNLRLDSQRVSSEGQLNA